MSRLSKKKHDIKTTWIPLGSSIQLSRVFGWMWLRSSCLLDMLLELWIMLGSRSLWYRSRMVLAGFGRGSSCLLDMLLEQWILLGSSILLNRLLGLLRLSSICLLDTVSVRWILLGSSIQSHS